MKPSRLAVDTNVLLDIADEAGDVLDAADLIAERLPAVEQFVTPSVLDELAYLADFGLTPSVRVSAGKAVQLLRNKDRFRAILELPFAPEKAEELAKEFRRRQLLPAEERHDALILAETVLLDCDILLTSDEHLRAIDHQQLTWVLNQHDLTAPVIATPREIVRKFFR
ncbi:MAG: type II toxin-antitoxin system VapC family toxin [Verrucomicrobiota bacterium]